MHSRQSRPPVRNRPRLRRWVARTEPVCRFAGRRLREAACGLVFGGVFILSQSPAEAVVVDNVRVLSRLGQPLSAAIRVTPAAGEVIRRGCFSTSPASGDLPGVGPVALRLALTPDGRVLEVTTAHAMREPLSELVLQVKCPGVPTIVRSFLIMIDPPGIDRPAARAATPPAVATPAAGVTPTTGRARPAAPAPVVASVARRAATPASRDDDPIQPGSRYVVRNGDTLSTIAARVAGRPAWSVWPLSQLIYRDNPGAFLLGDPNVLAEGATLMIPPLEGIGAGAGPMAAAPLDRPVAPSTAAPAPAPAPARSTPPPAALRASAAPVSPPTPAPPVENVAVVAPVAPVPDTLRLTTVLLAESRMKIALRASGALPPLMPAGPVPVGIPRPEPGDEARGPDEALAARTASPSRPDAGTGLGRWWLVIGGLATVLLGLAVVFGLLRRRQRAEPGEPVRTAGAGREMQPAAAESAAATGGTDSAPVSDNPSVAREALRPPAEANGLGAISLAGLDFDVTPSATDASTGSPAAAHGGLDLEFPDESTGQSGLQEVDFELLEKAYSEDYQTEFVDNPAPTTLAGGTAPEPVSDSPPSDEDVTTMLDLGATDDDVTRILDLDTPDDHATATPDPVAPDEDITRMLDLGAADEHTTAPPDDDATRLEPVATDGDASGNRDTGSNDEYATEMLDLGADDENDGRYYHLEGRDADDDTPLPFESGGDNGNDDPDDDGKVVSFRRGNG